MNNEKHSALWYVRFYNSFFESKAIKDIERLPDSRFSRNFSSFVIHLYFKLIAYSLEVQGNLIFNLTLEENDDLAYSVAKTFGFMDKLAETKNALMLLERYGLIETVKTEEYNQLFIPYVPDNSGRLKLSSQQRQQRRLAAKRGELYAADGRENEKLKPYGKLKAVYLTNDEYRRLREQTADIDALIRSYSLKVLNRTKKESDYEELLRYAHSLGGSNE